MAVLAFTAGAYIAWLDLFAIERYAVAIEILAGLLAVILLAEVPPPRAGRAVAVAALVGLAALTAPPEWWHRPWTDPYRPVIPAVLAEPAAFVVVWHPNGYWPPLLSLRSRFYEATPMGLATGGLLRQRIVDGLAHPPGGRIWTLGVDVPMDPATRSALASYGLVPRAPCVRAESLWWVPSVFCRATVEGPRPLAASDLAPGAPVDFSDRGSGWIYEVSGWANAGPAGTPIAGDAGRLVFRTDMLADRPLVLTLTAPSTLDVTAADGRALPAQRAPPPRAQPPSACCRICGGRKSSMFW